MHTFKKAFLTVHSKYHMVYRDIYEVYLPCNPNTEKAEVGEIHSAQHSIISEPQENEGPCLNNEEMARLQRAGTVVKNIGCLLLQKQPHSSS